MPTKWASVADALRSEINNGILRAELPSESDLVERFSVSRNTVRSALDQLGKEGLIDGSQGSRRRVRQDERICWPMHMWEKRHASDTDAWAQSVTVQGHEPSAEVTVALEPATGAIADALQLDPGSTVVVRRRVRHVDGQAHQLADSYFPYELVKDHPKFLMPGDQAAPGGLLAHAGLPQARLLDVIESRMPTPDEMRLLAMAQGTPLLIHRRTGYLKNGTPVRHMVTRMSATRVEISYEVRL